MESGRTAALTLGLRTSTALLILSTSLQVTVFPDVDGSKQPFLKAGWGRQAVSGVVRHQPSLMPYLFLLPPLPQSILYSSVDRQGHVNNQGCVLCLRWNTLDKALSLKLQKLGCLLDVSGREAVCFTTIKYGVPIIGKPCLCVSYLHFAWKNILGAFLK